MAAAALGGVKFVLFPRMPSGEVRSTHLLGLSVGKGVGRQADNFSSCQSSTEQLCPGTILHKMLTYPEVPALSTKLHTVIGGVRRIPSWGDFLVWVAMQLI